MVLITPLRSRASLRSRRAGRLNPESGNGREKRRGENFYINQYDNAYRPRKVISFEKEAELYTRAVSFLRNILGERNSGGL